MALWCSLTSKVRSWHYVPIVAISLFVRESCHITARYLKSLARNHALGGCMPGRGSPALLNTADRPLIWLAWICMSVLWLSVTSRERLCGRIIWDGHV